MEHSIQSSTYADSITKAFWYDRVIRDQLGYTRRDNWTTDGDIPDEWRSASVLENRAGAQRDVDLVFPLLDGFVRVDLDKRGNVDVLVAAKGQPEATAIWDAIRAAMPKRKKKGDGRIEVGFWFDTPHGPRREERRIVAPSWEEIADNYGAKTRTGLEMTMHDFRPSHGGQILLWQGIPGSGKTFALRALCREWRDWCTAEYIVDPDNAFGENPAYLMQLLLGSSDESEAPDDGKAQWKLLILEDTGELIGEQAKAEAGQGLSRLLNVADGFLGQGLRVLVLITTNEEIKKLHPAVSRPGRAASVILFEPLTALEAHTWLSRHDLGDKWSPEIPKTLADLYAVAEQYPKLGDEKKVVGFRVAG